MKNLIVIVGLPGSGKTFASEIIKSKFKADTFHTGDIIRQEIKRRGWKYTPKTDTFIAHWFHSQGREKLLLSRLWNQIKK